MSATPPSQALLIFMKSETAPYLGAEGSFFAFDTTLVLFFLALDLGQTIFSPDVGAILSGMSVLAIAAAPYLIFGDERPDFWTWLGARLALAGFGLLTGALLGNAVGSLLPESFRFVPITLLILAAFVSFCLQFYGILRVRLAR
jgi:hypothetical protein